MPIRNLPSPTYGTTTLNQPNFGASPTDKYSKHIIALNQSRHSKCRQVRAVPFLIRNSCNWSSKPNDKVPWRAAARYNVNYEAICRQVTSGVIQYNAQISNREWFAASKKGYEQWHLKIDNRRVRLKINHASERVSLQAKRCGFLAMYLDLSSYSLGLKKILSKQNARVSITSIVLYITIAWQCYF